MAPTAFEIAKCAVEDAPNQDWHRPFEIAYDKTITMKYKNKTAEGKIVIGKFTTALEEEKYVNDFKFMGFSIIEVPDFWIYEVNPIIVDIKCSNWVSVYNQIAFNIKSSTEDWHFNPCCNCGTLRPAEQKRGRQIAREAVEIIYQCRECGHREYDVFD